MHGTFLIPVPVLTRALRLREVSPLFPRLLLNDHLDKLRNGHFLSHLRTRLK